MLTDTLPTEFHGSLPPPPGAAADWTIPQQWEKFSAEEHRVWDILFARQQALLAGRAVRAFGEGLDVLRLARPGIPNLDALNDSLFARTGWQVVSVPGLLPDDIFFAHLSRRRFPAGNFIRSAAQLDYLEEPDVFHDIFGHVPLLASPAIADFLQALGALGMDAVARGTIGRLARLYWYTVEFGLAREGSALKIYGAGLLSSFGEAHHSLESPEPGRYSFDMVRVMRTRYRPDAFQQAYFVVDNFDRLLDQVLNADLPALYAELEGSSDLDPAASGSFVSA